MAEHSMALPALTYSKSNGPYDVQWREARTGREGRFDAALSVLVYPEFTVITMAPVGRAHDPGKNYEKFVLPHATHTQIAIEKTLPQRTR